MTRGIALSALLVAPFLLATTCEHAHVQPDLTREPTVLGVIPDTQGLNAWHWQMVWELRWWNRISFIAHLGDITDRATDTANLSAMRQALDSSPIPWGVSPGCHDSNTLGADDWRKYRQWFGDQPTDVVDSTGLNRFSRIQAVGWEYGVVLLERDNTSDRARDFLHAMAAENPHLPLVVVNHANLSTLAYPHPDSYNVVAVTPLIGPRNEHVGYFERTIAPIEQVFLVVNGHAGSWFGQPEAIGSSQRRNAAGLPVTEIMVNCQNYDLAGDTRACVGAITLNPVRDEIHLETRWVAQPGAVPTTAPFLHTITHVGLQQRL